MCENVFVYSNWRVNNEYVCEHMCVNVCSSHHSIVSVYVCVSESAH